MRPKRNIMLFCADQLLASRLRLVIGLDPTMRVVEETPDALDCVIVVNDEHLVRLFAPVTKVVALLPKGTRLSETHAHEVRNTHDIAGIRDAVRIACSRKRGPNPRGETCRS